jgi:hypothetical protein
MSEATLHELFQLEKAVSAKRARKTSYRAHDTCAELRTLVARAAPV